MARETLAPPPEENICALVIGEHAGMRQLLKLILGAVPGEVHEASSNDPRPGTFAKLPRVVVVDVDPSFEEGMVVWHSLRRNPSTANIPSVFLVEAGNEFVRHLATLAGATICVEKPFHPRELRTIIERLLSLEPGSDAVDARSSDARRSAPL